MMSLAVVRRCLPISSLSLRCYGVSLGNLYAGVTEPEVKLHSVEGPSHPTATDFNGFIPMEKLQIKYTRSSGPGGQHVNKTNSKAAVTFDVVNADWIPEATRKSFVDKYKRRITVDGHMSVESERTRVASLNLADCLDKIRSAIRECEMEVKSTAPPTDSDLEILQRRQEAAARARLREKRDLSMKKQQRQAETF